MWAAVVGYVKRTVLRRRLKVSAVGESLVWRGKSFQIVGAIDNLIDNEIPFPHDTKCCINRVQINSVCEAQRHPENLTARNLSPIQ